MGCKIWSLTAKPCDSCRAAPPAVFCRAESAFLCASCDAEIHGPIAASSSRHPLVPVCGVCGQAPAAVTCKADAAALCAACDGDIHSANLLARRHERLPVVPFYDAAKISSAYSEEEAEAAAWLLPGSNIKFGDEPGSPPEYKSADYLFGEMDPFLDLDLVPGKQKSGDHVVVSEEKQYSSDGVVPVQTKNEYKPGHCPGPVVDDEFLAYDVDFPGSKSLIMYNFTSKSITRARSVSSSLDVGVVPDHVATADISNNTTFPKNDTNVNIPTRLSGFDRESRVLRYREKRKIRKFDKTIRYASRKAYAETRPRIKGRFAKRSIGA